MLRFTHLFGMLNACMSGDPTTPSGDRKPSWHQSSEFLAIKARLEEARSRLADENSEPLTEEQLKTLEDFGAHVIAAQLRGRYRAKRKPSSVGKVLGQTGMGSCETR
jgi:hypothetical protein